MPLRVRQHSRSALSVSTLLRLFVSQGHFPQLSSQDPLLTTAGEYLTCMTKPLHTLVMRQEYLADNHADQLRPSRTVDAVPTLALVFMTERCDTWSWHGDSRRRPRGDANCPNELLSVLMGPGGGDGAGQSAVDGSFLLFIFSYLLMQPRKRCGRFDRA